MYLPYTHMHTHRGVGTTQANIFREKGVVKVKSDAKHGHTEWAWPNMIGVWFQEVAWLQCMAVSSNNDCGLYGLTIVITACSPSHTCTHTHIHTHTCIQSAVAATQKVLISTNNAIHQCFLENSKVRMVYRQFRVESLKKNWLRSCYLMI